jgi:subtilase family serine protease
MLLRRRTPILRTAAVSLAAVSTLAAASVSGPAAGASTTAPGGSGRGASGPDFDCLTLASPTCYSPLQFRTAYGIQPLINRGINGRGETVVLPETAAAPGEAGDTDIRQDLARYDTTFGLPAANLRVNTTLVPGASPFQAPGEYVEDVEVVHAIAPQATLQVILVPDNTTSNGIAASVIKDYSAALRMAASLGSVVSLSDSVNENCFTPAQLATLHSTLQFDQEHHVTVVASSGDFGAAGPGAGAPVCSDSPVRQVGYPASDPLVLGVGGTSLDASHATGAYIGETVWNRPDPSHTQVAASTGGFSNDFARPAYQDGVPGVAAHRGVPDVSADADQDTGLAAVLVTGGNFVIGPAVGTSASAPFWAAIVALADQYAGRHLGFINPAIYQIGRSAQYYRAFHDIIKGNNTVRDGSVTVKGFNATTGWDPATGWGSPDAQVLIPLLARRVTG